MLIPKVLVALVLFSQLPATSPINCYWGSIPSETDAEGFTHHVIRDNHDACAFVWDLQNNTIVFGGLEKENGTMSAHGCTKTEELMMCVCTVDLCVRPEIIESYWKSDANVTVHPKVNVTISSDLWDEVRRELSILEFKSRDMGKDIDDSDNDDSDNDDSDNDDFLF